MKRPSGGLRIYLMINCSLWQKIVFQSTQKDSIVLLETHIASNLSMQTTFYGELSIVIHSYHPTINITSSQNSRSEMQLTPKGLDCVFWLYSNFGQVSITKNFHISG